MTVTTGEEETLREEGVPDIVSTRRRKPNKIQTKKVLEGQRIYIRKRNKKPNKSTSPYPYEQIDKLELEEERVVREGTVTAGYQRDIHERLKPEK